MGYYHWEHNRLDLVNETGSKDTWTSKGNHIYFTSDPEKDIDQKHTLNLTNTKGRWDAKKQSPHPI